jgi:hypothetical protein
VKSRFVGVLKEAEAGVPVKDLCRREVNETRRLRQVEEERSPPQPNPAPSPRTNPNGKLK